MEINKNAQKKTGSDRDVAPIIWIKSKSKNPQQAQIDNKESQKSSRSSSQNLSADILILSLSERSAILLSLSITVFRAKSIPVTEPMISKQALDGGIGNPPPSISNI